jgi:hypothetical protein
VDHPTRIYRLMSMSTDTPSVGKGKDASESPPRPPPIPAGLALSEPGSGWIDLIKPRYLLAKLLRRPLLQDPHTGHWPGPDRS